MAHIRESRPDAGQDFQVKVLFENKSCSLCAAAPDGMSLPIQMRGGHGGISSDTMHLSIGFRKSTPQPNRQLDILISKSTQQVDDFWGELAFYNYSINTSREMIWWTAPPHPCR